MRLSLIGPVAPGEFQGFKSAEMVACEKCLRANPPTRVSCLYCGFVLTAPEELQRLRRPTLKQPDKHQLGYNSILCPSAEKDLTNSLTDAADLLKLSVDDFNRIVGAGVLLPVARTASAQEA